MRRYSPYLNQVRLLLLFTLVGSLSALLVEIASKSDYLLTRHVDARTAIAQTTPEAPVALWSF